jgi:hypothetical protein
MTPLTSAGLRLSGMAALLFSIATPALAQDPTTEPGRPTLMLGPIEVRPRIVFSNVGVDNNVFNEFEDPKSDFTATVSPDVELMVRPGPLRLSLSTGTDFVYFRTYDSERSTGRRFATRADFDFPVVKPFISYSAAHTSARSGGEVDLRARNHPRELAGGARLLLASGTWLRLSARRSTVDYDGGVLFRGVELAETLNSTTNTYNAAFGVAVTPLTTVSLTATMESARFERTALRDSRSFRIAPQITISPLGLLTGTASIGYRRFEGRDASMPSYSGLSANGSLGLVLVDRYRIESTFVRDVRYSYEESLPYYVQTAGRLSLATYLFGGIDVRVLGGRETMAYRAFLGGEEPGRDVLTTYGGGFGYRIGDQLYLVVTAENVDRVSARDVTREYGNNRIFATLSWGAFPR